MDDSPFDLPAILTPFLPEGPVAVAVSGGPDSMALCHALCRAAHGKIHALTVDHGLRPEAAAEARQVGAWLAGWKGAAHRVLTRQIPAPDAARVQESARRDRYRLLADYCAGQGIDRLFTAHHLDDQAETFLFRLAKGSGLDGLAAIRPTHPYGEKLVIVRPFLEVPKSALVEYCRTQKIPYINDPSNQKDEFARVRLRKAYDVLAAEGLTSGRLARTAERLARAREALEILAADLYEKALVLNDASRIEFDSRLLEGQPEELRLRVLGMALERIGGPRDYPPRLERLEALALAAFQPGFKRTSFAGCLVGIDAGKARLIIEKESDGA